ncbi:polysaccharide deacetylase family protein [Sphingopyxis sp. MWB1]|uniref:polysaccharide deacetylase family protein n=1 Tax=Sphingopyxis sp. MWB1 TaxID=1537715 RepID=UPI00051A1B7E|nr:polysaccharide deacetylase family protein [Sphingopyxis sp. MWB1]
MTRAIISFDTELSAGLFQRGADARANFESSILGRCREGDFGISFQMDMLERHGLKGVYFVDPMPALVYGPSVIRDIVAPIVARGHEVQLHIHTEWLAFARFNPVGKLTGRNIGDFPLAAQKKLIGLARDMLVRAGAPTPTAFRAGNFGATDDTLRALAALGFRYDSSFNAAYVGQGCGIGLDSKNMGMRDHHGVVEVPVSGLMERAGRFRPAQLCAMSQEEMRDALDHAARRGAVQFSAFSHSFELLSRDREAPNGLAITRMDALCRAVAEDPRLSSGGFADLAPPPGAPAPITVPGPRPLRTWRRVAQQAWGHLRHEVGYIRSIIYVTLNTSRWGKVAGGVLLAMA